MGMQLDIVGMWMTAKDVKPDDTDERVIIVGSGGR